MTPVPASPACATSSTSPPTSSNSTSPSSETSTPTPRRALARALALFADELGATLVAEGIETHAELTTLQNLGVAYGPGYHLGRPAPLEAHNLSRTRYTGLERRRERPWSTTPSINTIGRARLARSMRSG